MSCFNLFPSRNELLTASGEFNKARNFFSFLAVFTLPLLIMLSGCRAPLLAARLDAISASSLASYHVDTPDTSAAPAGERLNISWAFPASFSLCQPIDLVITVHLRNHTEEQRRIRIGVARGLYSYEVQGDVYFTSGGIQAYKIELWSDGHAIASCHHQLWSQWIHIGK